MAGAPVRLKLHHAAAGDDPDELAPPSYAEGVEAWKQLDLLRWRCEGGESRATVTVFETVLTDENKT